MKIINRASVIIFIIFLAFPSIVAVTGLEDNQYILQYENRNLYPFPDFSKPDKLKEQIENYFGDRLGGRQFFLRSLSKLKYHLNSSINPDKVLVGRDGWLYLQMKYVYKTKIDTSKVFKFIEALELLHDWCKRNDTIMIFAMPPRKHFIYPEFLYDFEINDQPSSELSFLIETLKTRRVNFVDLRYELIDKKNSAFLYYKLDTHWNNLGAFHAYQSICKKAYELINEPWKPLSFHFEYLEGGRRGLESMIYLKDLEQRSPVVDFSPRREYALYKNEKLVKQEGLHKISNHDVPIEARNEFCDQKKKIVWLRDSFGDAGTPSLMQYFSNVFAYDYRTGGSYNKNPLRIDNIIKKHKPDFLIITTVENRAFKEIPRMINFSFKNDNEI